jgi:hypothetical protein
MATKARKKAKKAVAKKAKRTPVKAKKAKKAKKAVKAKAKKKKAPVRPAVKAKAKTKSKRKAAKGGVVKTVQKAAKRLVAAAKRAVSPAPKEEFGEGNYTASRNFRKKETSFIDNNRDLIAKKAKEAEAAIDGPEGAELEAAREETAAHGQE